MNFVKRGTSALLVGALMVVGFSGCEQGSGKNVKIDGVDGPYVNFVDNKFTMTVVLKNVQIDGGLRMPMPHMEKSYFEVGPDFKSNGTLLSIGMDSEDLKFLKDNLKLLDPNALPGGRPLPGVIEGHLPSFAIEVPKLNDTVFYFSPSVFGAFVPVKLGMKGYMASFRYYDAANDPVGTISLVGEDEKGENSGFLLLINMGGKVGQLGHLN